MLNFIYFIISIVATFVAGYITYKQMKKIQNVRIHQKSEKMEGVKGAEFELKDGEDLHIKDMEITQGAKDMKNVTGLSFGASGQQSARLQGVRIKQPGAEVVISDDPNVRIEINKQE